VASHSVEQGVKSVVGQVLSIPVEQIQPAAHLQDDLGADSLHRIEIQMALEDQFDIQIPDEDVESLRTVGDVMRCIEEHLA
jgi:acyl carrier protein